MRRELNVRFCEGGGVRFPSATRLGILTLKILISLATANVIPGQKVFPRFRRSPT